MKINPYEEVLEVQCQECGWFGDVEEMTKRMRWIMGEWGYERETETFCPDCGSADVE